MTFAEIAGFAGFLTSLVSLLSVVYLAGVKISALSVKVDTMWDFMWRRAKSEAVAGGFATMNSPVVVTAEAKALVKPLIAPLREFYARLGRKLTDKELALEIERRYGDTLLDKICIPNGMMLGACLLIIIAELKDDASAGAS